MILEVPAPCEFINSNQRLHRMAQAKLTAAWRAAGSSAADTITPLTPPVHITAWIWKPRAGRYDPNNLAPTTKAIVDGIVDAGVLEDDSVEYVIGPDHRHGGKGPAKIVIEIEEVASASNKNNWRRLAENPCGCGCGKLVAKEFSKGHGRRKPVGDRFAEKVNASLGRDACWKWIGAVGSNGYGRISSGVSNELAQAHRLAYELLVGPIPKGLHVDHLCANRLCVNPLHLEPVTQAENNRRVGKASIQPVIPPGDDAAIDFSGLTKLITTSSLNP